MKNRIKLPWWSIKIKKENFHNIKLAFINKKFSLGSITQKVENLISKKINSKFSLLTTSGSAAILMILIYLKKKSKLRNIIIANRCWISPAHAVHLLGLNLIFVDVKKDVPICDEDEISKKVDNKTLAIICVQLNGHSVNIKKLKSILKKKNKKVPFIIEDAAQSFFSKNQEGNFIGTSGDASILSFSMGKIVSSGQGGAVITQNRNIYNDLKLIRNNGVINRYTDAWNTFGFNFKYTDIQSSLLLNQIKKINENKLKLKRLHKIYAEGLKNNKFVKVINVNQSKNYIPLYVETISSKRDKIVELLMKNGFQCRKIYPSLHTTKYFNQKKNKFKNSSYFEKNLFYLPSGPDQNLKEVKKLISLLKNLNEL